MLFHSEVRVKSRDGDSVWPPSSLMIWEPGDSHFYGTLSGPWDHSWFHCSGQAVTSILSANRIAIRQRIPVRDISLMEKCLLEMVGEVRGWRKADPVILRNLFENFVRGLARQTLDRTEIFVPSNLLALRNHIEQHFEERLPLTTLASRTGWSVPHLCTEFKRFFGVPVTQYILQLRMNQAVYLLRDQNHRIGEIANFVGYPDLYTFSKMFKRYFGESPRRFRDEKY